MNTRDQLLKDDLIIVIQATLYLVDRRFKLVYHKKGVDWTSLAGRRKIYLTKLSPNVDS